MALTDNTPTDNTPEHPVAGVNTPGVATDNTPEKSTTKGVDPAQNIAGLEMLIFNRPEVTRALSLIAR